MSEHRELEALVAWWLGELPPEEGDAVEEHLFACDGCARRAHRLAALAEGIAAGARGVSGVLPDAILDALQRQGVRIRTFEVEAGRTVPCSAAPDDDLLNARLVGDFRAEGRLDVLVVGPDGGVQERKEDVIVDRAAGALNVCAGGDEVRSWPSMRLHFRVVAVTASGERSLGDFILEHSA